MRAAGRWPRRRGALALAVVLLAASSCSGDDPAALPVTGTGVGSPGVSVTRTVSETTPADSATVVVVLEVPYDEFDVPPTIDSSAVVAALEAAGFDPDLITVSVGTDVGLDVEVEVDPAQLPQVGTDIVRVVEEAAGIAAIESGVVFGVRECSDLVAELRRRAVVEAREEARLLADAAEIELGPVIGVWDSGGFSFATPSFVPAGAGSSGGCPAALDSTFASAFGSLGEFDDFGPGYQPFDADPEADVSVSLTVTFAVGGMASTTGAPAAAISVTGRATVDGDADDGYVIAYVDVTSVESAAQLEEDLLDDLSDLGVIDGDIAVELGYDAVIQVRLPADRVAEDGPEVIDAIESRASSAYETGAWFMADACPDILEEARAAAFADATEQARGLATSSGVDLGAPILVADASFDYLSVPPDRCRDLPADAGDGYPVELENLDADPRLSLEVWLDVSFAITG